MASYSMEPEDVLLVTDGVKDVIDGIVHEMEFGIYPEHSLWFGRM